MSKSIFSSTSKVSEFHDAIGTVSESASKGGGHYQKRLRSAFENAKAEGFEEGIAEGKAQGMPKEWAWPNRNLRKPTGSNFKVFETR